MLYGTGMDIIEIQRFKHAGTKHPKLKERLFTPAELAYCQTKRDPWPHLAARFAAKEAVIKVFGGRRRLSFREIEIGKEGPRPVIFLQGKAQALARKLGINEWQVSITHSRDYAAAVVLALTEDGKGD
ncbi:MAG: holo-ACP synthase [Firmicutes bacterium]|nr:holo-ACP synthase [Bacillota bacterium]